MDEMKTISLKDLKSSNQDSTNLSEVKADEIRPMNTQPDPVEEKISGIMTDLDIALSRREKVIDEKREEIYNELYEAQLEEQIQSQDSKEDITLEQPETETPKVYKEFDNNDTSKSDSIFVYDSDMGDLLDDDESAEEQIKAVKSAIKEKIKPVTNVIDISSFSIAKKPVSVLNTLKTNLSSKKTIDWVLPATGISITMEALSGFEIQKLNPQTSSKNRFNTYKEIYGILHEHIVDANKPKTIEEWVKQLNFFDINHIYFTAYKASFDGANSIPYSCPHCKEIFMIDTEIDNMIKYKDDEVKKQIQQILQQDTNNINEYNVELVQVSDEYVIGLREPSIYNVIFENVVLDEKFTEKYNELLSLLAYVDSIYYINREENTLQPIELKQYSNNAVKTIKNRIIKYSQILQSLTSDQFYAFNAYIKAINDKHDEMVYVLPEVTCPKCGKVIPEQEMDAETLLFTRHQLAGIANT